MKLKGKKVAILAENDYETRELWYPRYRLEEEGAEVVILGTGQDQYVSKHGLAVSADMAVDDANPDDYSAVIIPGGYAPDSMRTHQPLLDFVKAIFDKGSIVGYICHAGWVAASADIVKGKRVTSFHSIRDDMVNAGAEWVDEAVVKDGNLISSRVPPDLPAFSRTLIESLSN